MWHFRKITKKSQLHFSTFNFQTYRPPEKETNVMNVERKKWTWTFPLKIDYGILTKIKLETFFGSTRKRKTRKMFEALCPSWTACWPVTLTPIIRWKCGEILMQSFCGTQLVSYKPKEKKRDNFEVSNVILNRNTLCFWHNLVSNLTTRSTVLWMLLNAGRQWRIHLGPSLVTALGRKILLKIYIYNKNPKEIQQ